MIEMHWLFFVFCTVLIAIGFYFIGGCVCLKKYCQSLKVEPENWGDLKEIVDFVGDPKTWLDMCIRRWDERAGWVKLENGKCKLITGGWSDNESIVIAMKVNGIMWASCWEMSCAGGSHEFKYVGW